MSKNKPCTLEVRRIYYRSDVSAQDWKPTLDGWARDGKVLWHRSVREAKRMLPLTMGDHVDYLSRAGYEARLRFADGTVRELGESIVEYAEQLAKWDQQDNSIGSLLRRGYTVAV